MHDVIDFFQKYLIIHFIKNIIYFIVIFFHINFLNKINN